MVLSEQSGSKKAKVDVDSATKSSECGPSVIISEALADFFGVGKREMLQSEVLRRIWEYINLNNLEVGPDSYPEEFFFPVYFKRKKWALKFHGFSISQKILVRSHGFVHIFLVVVQLGMATKDRVIDCFSMAASVSLA